MSGYVTALDRILDALRDHGPKVVRPGAGGNVMAQCPAHEDRNPSLALRQIEGHALVKCHAGCRTTDVLDALGLTTADLYDDRRGVDYQYTDAAGRPTRRVIRDSGKRFRQEGETRLKQLYRLPKVIEAVRAGQPVYLVEGEKDVHALESLGVVATTAPEGAANVGKVDFGPLKGATVIAVADRDAPGQRWAATLGDRLTGYAASLTVVEAKDGKDAADHIMHGHGVDQFVRLASDDEARPSRRTRITWASEIEPEPVEWAWQDEAGRGRIPAGSLSIAAGREGTGKSSFGIWLAAQITNGTLPGAFYGQPRTVLYVAVEDSWKHTLVPRLMAAGARLDKVGRFEVVTDEDEDATLSLPADNALLEVAIKENDAALVAVDPLMSVISERLDTHREREVRTALDPLAKLAGRTGAMILGIAHFNKGGSTDAASLITGSGAFKNVPRSIFGFAKDEADPGGDRIMTQVKNSLGLCDELPSLTYAIQSATVETPKGPAETGKFTFTGTSSRTVADVLRDARADNDPEERQDRRAAEDFLRKALAEGSRLTKQVTEEADQLGISERTLKRARKAMGVQAEQLPTGTAGRNEWWISLPKPDDPEGQSARVPEGQPLETGTLPGTLPQSANPEGQLLRDGTLALWPPAPGANRPQVCTECGRRLLTPESLACGVCIECVTAEPA